MNFLQEWFIIYLLHGPIAQLVRALAWHARGQEFESPWVHNYGTLFLSMNIFIIGPGGVGKSTCGPIVASVLGYRFIDLDQEFHARIGHIGNYIKDSGYRSYCFENSKVFYDIVQQGLSNAVFTLSSGFLVYEHLEHLTTKHKQSLKELGTSVVLLPSRCIDMSTDIVVKRQLKRGFGLQEDKERETFMRRFFLYQLCGDIHIFSHDQPKKIAKHITHELLKNTKK